MFAHKYTYIEFLKVWSMIQDPVLQGRNWLHIVRTCLFPNCEPFIFICIMCSSILIINYTSINSFYLLVIAKQILTWIVHILLQAWNLACVFLGSNLKILDMEPCWNLVWRQMAAIFQNGRPKKNYKYLQACKSCF